MNWILKKYLYIIWPLWIDVVDFQIGKAVSQDKIALSYNSLSQFTNLASSWSIKNKHSLQYRHKIKII